MTRLLAITGVVLAVIAVTFAIAAAVCAFLGVWTVGDDSMRFASTAFLFAVGAAFTGMGAGIAFAYAEDFR